MLKFNQIPDEVRAAFYEAYWKDDLSDQEALAAAINAWPGIIEKQANENLLLANLNPALILPLTEPSTSQIDVAELDKTRWD
jgi:hypothetical protein